MAGEKFSSVQEKVIDRYSLQEVPDFVQKDIEDIKSPIMKFTEAFDISVKKIEFSDKSSTYVVYIRPVYRIDRKLKTDYVLLVDEVKGAEAGYSIIDHNHAPGCDFPHVGNIETYPEIDTTEGRESLRRRGLALRRYRTMNKVCKEAFGQELHSGELNNESEAVWKRLVDLGEAAKQDVGEDDYGAFKFI